MRPPGKSVATGEEVGRSLETDEAVITADEPVIGIGVTSLGESDQITVLNLKLTFSVR
jgi:hypothetical protein